MPLMILDGYTRETTIGPAHGHPPVFIAFRPALPEVVANFRRTPKINGKDYVKEIFLFLKEHLLKWDVEDPRTKTKADFTDFEIIRRIPLAYLEAMVEEVSGTGLGSKPSESSDDAKN